AFGEPDVAVDVHRGDVVDGPRGCEPVRRGVRVAAVEGRRVCPDGLGGGVDDVQVVEVLLGVPDERADGDDVAAPLGRTRDADAVQGALAARVCGAPLPDDVLRIDDHEVADAHRDELRRAL